MWVIDLLVILPSPYPKTLARPFTLKVLRARERAPIASPFVVFTFGLVVESIQEFRGASIGETSFKYWTICRNKNTCVLLRPFEN
jgi:hypothetical protein